MRGRKKYIHTLFFPNRVTRINHKWKTYWISYINQTFSENGIRTVQVILPKAKLRNETLENKPKSILKVVEPKKDLREIMWVTLDKLETQEITHNSDSILISSNSEKRTRINKTNPIQGIQFDEKTLLSKKDHKSCNHSLSSGKHKICGSGNMCAENYFSIESKIEDKGDLWNIKLIW